MSFLNPEVLYYLLPPLFVFFGFLLTQKEADASFFSDEVMDKLRVSANSLTIKARNALFLLIGIFLVVALAGPVIKDGTIVVKAKSADIMIAFDISDSMLAGDVYPNRLKFAKEKAMELLKSAPDERIGVIAFAKNSYLVSPMSFDHSAVGFLLRQLNTDSITEKGTDFLSLLNVVDKSIKKESKKYLLILSDGGDKDDFSEEIAYAKEKNIVVFILGIGTPKGAPIKLKNGSFIKHDGKIIVSKLNENISKLATSTGGVYIEGIKSDSDIKTMFKEIERVSEQQELKSEEVQKFIPLFYYPLAVAILLLLIATSSMGRKNSQTATLFILFSLLFVNPHAEAGVLDFMELKEAKEAYQSGDYERSAKLYFKHAESTGNAHSYFNAGNAFYEQKKYKEAVKLYEKAVFKKKEYKANKFGNLGNAHAKQGTQENLEKAKKYYEESLKLVDDEEIKDNLEKVKKMIKKKKEEKKKEKKKDGKKEDKDAKDENGGVKKEDKDGKEKGSKKDKNGEKSKDDSSKSKESKEDNKTKDSNAGTPHAINQDKMSDAEEKKWLEMINKEQNTYMYQLNDTKPQERNTDEKPW